MFELFLLRRFADPDTGVIWTAYVTECFPSKYLNILRYRVTNISKVDVMKIYVGRIGHVGQDNSYARDRIPDDDHQLVDFAIFNTSTLTLLLREVKDDEVSILLQLPLAVLPESCFSQTSLHRGDQQHLRDVTAVDVGPLLHAASASYQTNASGLSIAVGGIRTTASLLLKSQRRIRLFLLEEVDEEEEAEVEAEGEGEESSMMVNESRDESEVPCEEGGEDKENIAD